MPEEPAGGELDPNTDAGFNAALAELAGVELSSEQRTELEDSDTSIAAGLTIEEESTESRPRDEQGRFTPAAPPEVETEGAAPTGEQETIDPALAALIEQHGGDVNAALADAWQQGQEAQSLIGRQGNEVGDLRQKLSELTGRVDGFQQPQPTAPLPYVDGQTSEAIESMVAERGGRGAMGWVVQNRPDLIDATLEAWGGQDPVGAADFAARRAVFETMHETQGEATATQSGPDPLLESIRMERSIGSALDQARTGLSEGEWTAISPFLVGELEKAPSIIQNAIVSGDTKTQQEGVGALVQLARGRAIAVATAQAKEENTARLTESKKSAQVATGSLRPVQERKPVDGEAKTPEEIRQAFHEALMNTETTSVRDGLTYSK